MFLLSKIVSIVTLYLAIYLVLRELIVTTESKAVKHILSMRPKTDNTDNSILYKISVKLAKRIELNPYYADELEKKLKKIKSNITNPSIYIAKIVTDTLTCIAICIVLWLGKLYIIALGLALIGLANSLNAIIEIDNKVDKINRSIEKEIPQFVRTIVQALKSERDLIKILEKYRNICGEDFQYDLDILITDLKTGNSEQALYRFDERVNIPLISTFVSGLLGSLKGVDQKTFFFILERDIKNMSLENYSKQLLKRPTKIKLSTTILIGCFIMILTYPLIIDIVKSLNFLK